MGTMQQRPSFGGEVPEPHTRGMNMLEQAMHQIDREALNLTEWPDEILRRAAQIESCYLVLHDSLLRHLPPHIRAMFPRPARQFGIKVEDGLYDEEHHDS